MAKTIYSSTSSFRLYFYYKICCQIQFSFHIIDHNKEERHNHEQVVHDKEEIHVAISYGFPGNEILTSRRLRDLQFS